MHKPVKVNLNYEFIIDYMVKEVEELYLANVRNTYNDVEGYESKEE
jgi:hypothetical protein